MHENLKHTIKNIWPKTKKVFTFLNNYLPTIVNTFSDFISNNIDIFIELLTRNILRTFSDIK